MQTKGIQCLDRQLINKDKASRKGCSDTEIGCSLVSHQMAVSKDLPLTMTLSMRNEKREKRNLGQNRLSDNTKVDFGTTKGYGQQWNFKSKHEHTSK